MEKLDKAKKAAKELMTFCLEYDNCIYCPFCYSEHGENFCDINRPYTFLVSEKEGK